MKANKDVIQSNETIKLALEEARIKLSSAENTLEESKVCNVELQMSLETKNIEFDQTSRATEELNK